MIGNTITVEDEGQWQRIIDADEVFAHSCLGVLKKIRRLKKALRRSHLSSEDEEAKDLIEQFTQRMETLYTCARGGLGELETEEEDAG